jgi:hypothetical protein
MRMRGPDENMKGGLIMGTAPRAAPQSSDTNARHRRVPIRRLDRAGARHVALLLAVIAAAFAAPATHAQTRWANQGTKCAGTQRVDFARLWGLRPLTDWVGICKRTRASGISGRSDGKLPSTCVQKVDGSVWAEWKYSNHASCKSAAAAPLRWGDVGHKCDGNQRVEYSRLWGLQPGTDWVGICRNTPAAGVSALSNGKLPSTCVQKVDSSVWAEWKYSNHASCGAHFEQPREAGCFGPNRQVYSARLSGDLGGQGWESACAATHGPAQLGRPDRCVKDALNTGIWGEWYSQRACTKPLQWGQFKDNGCVRDMRTPDANAGGISGAGMRSYSAVLWNAGGNWLEACRMASARVPTHAGHSVSFPYPTACAIADAQDALSWVTAAVIGAGTAFITSPTGPYAIAASGAAIGLASKAAEAGLFELMDTSLNVWGIFWVRDESCGPVDPRDFVQRPVGIPTAPQPGARAGGGRAPGGPDDARRRAELLSRQQGACPPTAAQVQGGLRCSCSGQQAAVGRVWGAGIYTSDSSICRAAVHTGVIPATGGDVTIRIEPGLGGYQGDARNGVNSEPWGAWEKSFAFEQR